MKNSYKYGFKVTYLDENGQYIASGTAAVELKNPVSTLKEWDSLSRLCSIEQIAAFNKATEGRPAATALITEFFLLPEVLEPRQSTPISFEFDPEEYTFSSVGAFINQVAKSCPLDLQSAYKIWYKTGVNKTNYVSFKAFYDSYSEAEASPEALVLAALISEFHQSYELADRKVRD